MDEEVCGGDDVEDGVVAGVGCWEPEGDREVVGGVTEGDGEEAVESDEEVGATVVVCWANMRKGEEMGRVVLTVYVRFEAEGGEGVDCLEDVVVDGVWV